MPVESTTLIRVVAPIALAVGAFVPKSLYVASSYYIDKYRQLSSYLEYKYEQTLQLVNLQPIKTEGSIDEFVSVYSKEYRVPANLLKANMITESALNSDAYSPKGAIGLAQIMPFNAKRCGVPKVSKLWDEEHNIRCGAQILSEELSTYKGDVVKALQSYNGGPGCINKCKESINHAQKVISTYAKLEYAEQQSYKDLG